MGRKTPPYEHWPTWTTARYFQFLRSGLRKLWLKWPPRFEALRLSRRTVTGQRHKYEHLCASCGSWEMQKNVDVDHIESAGALNCHDDLKGFVSRLLCGSDGLRILCKPCHKRITKEDKENGV